MAMELEQVPDTESECNGPGCKCGTSCHELDKLKMVVEKINVAVQSQGETQQQIVEEIKCLRVIMETLATCLKSPVIPNVLVVDNQEDYTTTSHDSGISLTNGNSVFSPSSSSKSTSDEDAEIQTMEESSSLPERPIALNQLADVAAKEGNIHSSYSNTTDNDHVESNTNSVQSIRHTEMHNLKKPPSSHEVSNGECGIENCNNESTRSSSADHDQGFYSMARFDGSNVVALYAGRDSSAMGHLDSRFSCSQMSISSGDYNTQVLPSITSELTNDGSAEFFMCENCCGEFSQHDSLMLHMKSCCDKRKNAITIVTQSDLGNSFENRIEHTILSQSSRHRSTRVIPCKYCERTFPTQHQVMSHERVHTGARPYVCYVCKVKFAHGGNMIKHIKNKHPNNNPYMCRHCQKAFKTYQDIQLHRKTRRCGGKDVLYAAENAHGISPPAIIRISKHHQCDENCCTTICDKTSLKRELDEDTDSSPESDDQLKLLGTSHPTLITVTPSSYFLMPKIKSEHEMKATESVIPSTESEFSCRHDLGLRHIPKPNVLEQDANLLLEYSTTAQIKSEPLSDFDKLQHNFKYDAGENIPASNDSSSINVKTELLD